MSLKPDPPPARWALTLEGHPPTNRPTPNQNYLNPPQEAEICHSRVEKARTRHIICFNMTGKSATVKQT